MKRRVSVLFATIVMIILFSISAFAAKPKLSKKAVSLTAGKTKTITLKNANKGTIKWTTSNKKIAAVKKKGKNKAIITAKKKGTAMIIAKYKGKKYQCKVTVKKVAATTSSDGKFSWKVPKTNFTVEKTGDPFYITVDATVKGKGHMLYIKVADKSVVNSTYDNWNMTTTKKFTFPFYPLKKGTTTVTLTCDGVSKKVTVTVTGDKSEVYQTSLKNYLDSNGNFIKSSCRRFERTETCFAYLDGKIANPNGSEYNKYFHLPFDGYNIGNCKVTLERIQGNSGVSLLPNGKMGDVLLESMGRRSLVLKLNIIDENGKQTQINTLDSSFSTTIESSDQQSYIENTAYFFAIRHPKTSTFSYGILHIKYRGLDFDLPFGTTFE